MRAVRRTTLAALAPLCLGCSDPTAAGDFAVAVDTLSVWALNGGPLNYPSAVQLVGDLALPAAVRVTADALFDVALDIDSAGRVVFLPVVRVLPTVSTRVVAIQPVTSSFEALANAPENGYQNDSTAVAVVGTTLAVGAETNWCSGQASTVTYAKLVIDHIDRVERRIDIRVASNPNCGLRSLVIPDE
jgi:hypothetical protein